MDRPDAGMGENEKGKAGSGMEREKTGLRLRPWKREELGLLLRWLPGEREMTLWCARKFVYPLTEAQLRAYYEAMEENRRGFIFAALDEHGRTVGHIMMQDADYEENSIYFGLIVVDPETRGKGYGKEMVALALQYASRILGMKRVTLRVFDNNPRAKHCYETAGFREEKREEAAVDFHGEPWTLIHMAAEL